jgi:hypothetical protein
MPVQIRKTSFEPLAFVNEAQNQGSDIRDITPNDRLFLEATQYLAL